MFEHPIGREPGNSTEGSAAPTANFHESPAKPTLSVVIGAYNAARTLPQCLQALVAQSDEVRAEIIVVDDCSTDATREVAREFPIQLIESIRHAGVAAARNRGAEAAQGEVLLFVDADVVPAPGALLRVAASMVSPELGGVIGSYDADPDDASIVSRFKNLAHHHFHQRSRREAITFWGACGAIRREAFFATGGFDEDRFRNASIEDVELGFRLSKRGVRILLDKDLQVKHLKRWTLTSLVATDVVRRAIPWTQLWIEHRHLQSDLNFSYDQRLAALVSVAMLPAVVLAFADHRIWWLTGGLLMIAWLLNRELFRLLRSRGGAPLAISGFFLQQLYYLYSLFGFAAGLALHLAHRLFGHRRLKADGQFPR